jgi:hypothetical protein
VYISALVVSALLAPGSGPEATPTEVVASLEGEWELVRCVADGKLCTIKRREHLVFGRGVAALLREGRKPLLVLSRVRVLGPDTFDEEIATERFACRYLLEGDTLTICSPLPGKPRPPALISTADPPTRLTVWKRR